MLGGEDYDIWLKITLLGLKEPSRIIRFGIMPDRLLKYRQHDGG